MPTRPSVAEQRESVRTRKPVPQPEPVVPQMPQIQPGQGPISGIVDPNARQPQPPVDPNARQARAKVAPYGGTLPTGGGLGGGLGGGYIGGFPGGAPPLPPAFTDRMRTTPPIRPMPMPGSLPPSPFGPEIEALGTTSPLGPMPPDMASLPTNTGPFRQPPTPATTAKRRPYSGAPSTPWGRGLGNF